MIRFVLSSLVVLSGSFLSLSAAEGQQRATPQGQVVHSRVAPVVMHRMVPPFHGKHVYRRGR